MVGVDIVTVKELLGHKTITVTLRYSHLIPSHKVRAVDILDSKLNERIGPVSERLLHANYTKIIQLAGLSNIY